MSEDLIFDLPEKEVDVSIGDKKYVLREASGDAACRYHNKMTSGIKAFKGEMTMTGSMADAEPLLVSACLFPIDAEGKVSTVNVPIQTVRKWPNRITQTLFQKIMEISPMLIKDNEDVDGLKKQREELDEKIRQAEEVKNLQSDTMDG